MGQDMRIVLEHSSAARGIDDNRVGLNFFKYLQILSSQLKRRPFDAGMIVDRATANLTARDQHFAAVCLKRGSF